MELEHHFHHVPTEEESPNQHHFSCCQCRSTVIFTVVNEGKAEVMSSSRHTTHHYHKSKDGPGLEFHCCVCDRRLLFRFDFNPLATVMDSLQRQHEMSPSIYLDIIQAAQLVVKRPLAKQEWQTKPLALNNKSGTFYMKLASQPGGIELLEACGFVRQGDNLVITNWEETKHKMLVSLIALRMEWQLRQPLSAEMKLKVLMGASKQEIEEEPLLKLLGTTHIALADTRWATRLIQTQGVAYPSHHVHYELGVHESDTDEMLVLAVDCLLQTRPYNHLRILELVFFAKTIRDDPPLLNELYGRVVAFSERAAPGDEACRELGIVPSADDGHIMFMFNELLDQKPDKADVFLTCLQVIADSRDSNDLRGFLQQQQEVWGQQVGKIQADSSRVSNPPRHNANPLLCRREEGMPVGLANDRNLCYFNSLAQAYYFIPQVRELVLHNRGSETTDRLAAERFVLELQTLFAFLHDTNRMYVSAIPTAQSLVRGRKGAFLGMQMDVHEINGWMLDYLESVMCVNADAPQSKLFRRLFHGEQLVTLTRATGEVTATRSSFSNAQIILTIGAEGYNSSLYGALDEYTSAAKVEMSGGVQAIKRTLFTQLPEVLFFPLQRLAFDQKSHSAVKRAQTFTFPARLYMDRYMAENDAEVSKRRSEVESTGTERSAIEDKIKSVHSYANTGHSVPAILEVSMSILKDFSLLEETDRERLLDSLQSASKRSAQVVLEGQQTLSELNEAAEGKFADMRNNVREKKSLRSVS
eukprot:TRINITY_DN2015_c0_g1_i2.p1 TRINITY_DN2015_c0_g1~~TRINITY_DN2015_c0_g1_i2.p1  ORF type:complete len:795 (+),score=144.35 TRINITY_DN2015_c0_g1_i2:123-2387(+)